MTTSRNMATKATAGAFSCVLACALASWWPTCAFAAVDSQEYPLELSALASHEGEKILSVVVPSSVSIVVKTSVVDGRILGFGSSPAEITNSAHSFAPINAHIAGVQDNPSGANKLLDYVDITFQGHHNVAIVEGENQEEPLFDEIAPGETGSIEVDLAQKSADAPVPKGSYATSATIKVAALG